MVFYTKGGGGGRIVATETELMRALTKARAEYPDDAVISDVELSTAALKHLPATHNYIQTFLSKRATAQQREDLKLPPKVKRRGGQ